MRSRAGFLGVGAGVARFFGVFVVLVAFASVCASSALGFGVVAGSPFPESNESDPVGAAFSPSGGLLALATKGSPSVTHVVLFSVNQTDGKLTEDVGSPLGWGEGGTDVAFSPNGAFLAVANDGGNVQMLAVNASSGELEPLEKYGSAHPTSVAFSPDGSLLAAATQDGVELFAVNTSTGALTLVPGSPFGPTGNEQPISVAFSPKGKLLTAADFSGGISVFKVNGETLTEVSGSPFRSGGGVDETGGRSLAFNPTGTRLAKANLGGGRCSQERVCVGTVSFYSVDQETGGLAELSDTPVASQLQFLNGKAIPFSVAFSADGKLLATADGSEGPAGGAVSVFSVEPATGTLFLLGGEAALLGGYYAEGVAFSPTAPLLAAAAFPGAYVFSTLDAPEASVQYPAPGGTYARGEVVHTEFSCSEGEGAPGIESCRDSNGAASSEGGSLETVTLGSHTYTVISKSKDGQTHSTTISYTVAEPNGPEFGRCVKVAAEKEGTKTVYRGWFTASTCLVKSSTRTSKYEWLPGAVKANYTTALKPTTKVTLETVHKVKVTCTGESGRGIVASGKTVQNVFVKFTGCASGTKKCTTAGHAEGELETKRLEGALGIDSITVKEGKETRHIGLDLYPVGETGAFIEYTCTGSPATTLSGSLIGPVPSDKALVTATIKYAATGGKQKPEHFEGSPTDVLTNTLSEQVGLTVTETQTNEEAVEINAFY
jgi:WD40 repeat protein